MQGGRAAAAVLAEPRGEESSTFPTAGACAKNGVCDKKRWNQGGGKAINSMGTAISPNVQENRVHFRGGVCPQPCQRQLLSWFGHSPSLDRLFLFPSVKPEMRTPTAFITSLRSVKT